MQGGPHWECKGVRIGNARGSALGMQGGLHSSEMCLFPNKTILFMNARGSALGMQGGLHWECMNARGSALGMQGGLHWVCKGVCIGSNLHVLLNITGSHEVYEKPYISIPSLAAGGGTWRASWRWTSTAIAACCSTSRRRSATML